MNRGGSGASRGTTAVRAAVFRGTREGVHEEDLLLDPPGPGEVRVRLAASGVCHSDLHVVDGEWERPVPIALGHEGAGIVEVVGEGVPAGEGHPAVGDLVVLAWTAPCGRCAACARGEAFLCSDPRGTAHRRAPGDVRLRRPDGTPIGVYSGIGTFATRQVVAAEAAIPIDPALSADQAALIGCAVTTGVGAVLRTARVAEGETVVVIGLGGVGLAAVMGARLAGARRIVAVDRVASKLERALEAGATDTLLAGDATLTRAAVVACLPAGADHVLEAIGLAATAELALDLVRPGGTVTLVGMTPQGVRAGIDVYAFVERGIRLLGSNYGSAVPAEVFPDLARRAVAGHLPIGLLVEERIAPGELARAFSALRRGEGARRVVVFDPSA